MPRPARSRAKPARKPASSASSRAGASPPDVESALAWLKRHGTKAGREGLARYAIPSDRAFGVPMRDIQALAKALGRDHGLAAKLWASGWHEARLLASYVGDPAAVTAAQMDRWCGEFDNWAVCDTVCFALFDRTPHAWAKVDQWAPSDDEYVRRAAFALLWGLSVHDKAAADGKFLRGLRHVQRAASDDRHYVKKAVNMALRAIGKRNRALHAAAVSVAERLVASSSADARWVGKDALRELGSRSVASRVERASRAAD